jgi:hypothetical protein
MGAMGGGMAAMRGRLGGGMGGGMAAMAGRPAGGMGGMGGGMAMSGGMGGMGGDMGGLGMGGMGGGPAGLGRAGAGMGGMGGTGDHRGRFLGLALVSQATELAIREHNPKSKQVLKKLEEPISMSFVNETPLEDVLKYIKQATTSKTYAGIPIYLDPAGLQELDKTKTSTVIDIDLEGIPLKTTLRIMLRQLGLAYCVRDGVLIISSPERIFEELREAQQELDKVSEMKEQGDAGGENANSDKSGS